MVKLHHDCIVWLTQLRQLILNFFTQFFAIRCEFIDGRSKFNQLWLLLEIALSDASVLIDDLVFLRF